jgi:hypothetical protein
MNAGYIQSGSDYVLTLRGWEIAERLRQQVVEGRQAFIAMWFHPGMDQAFEAGFAPALRECGYQPFRIDRSPHENKIDDEIIANIRKSRILISDLTGARPNVFYETGFAAGLGRKVLFTCHAQHVGHYLACQPHSETPPAPISESWFDQISRLAFDVRQYPVLRWHSPDDLKKQLKDRIEALGLALTPSM